MTTKNKLKLWHRLIALKLNAVLRLFKKDAAVTANEPSDELRHKYLPLFFYALCEC